MQSIGDVGLLSPLVIDKKHQGISGNRRLSTIRELGWKKVECEFAERNKVEKSATVSEGWLLVWLESRFHLGRNDLYLL